MNSKFSFDPLRKDQDRTGFDCGVEALNRYFRDFVTQDIKRQLTRCFVARDTASDRIAGYYTLAAAEIPLGIVSAEAQRKLPRYPRLPAARVGRLAADIAFRGQNVGGGMIIDALRRARSSDIAAYALLVDAKDETAAGFYRHFSFTPFPTNGLTLFLPL